MISIDSLDDIAALRESFDVECKLAQGRDGKGSCPKSLWETYSAFANSQGGDLFLGLEERSSGQFELAGIENTQKVMDELWSGLNDRDLVSCNVLRSDGIRCLKINGVNVIQVHVPPASRTQRPVYIKGNPLKGTYKRFNSADIRQSEEVVRRMLAEQVEDSRDNAILRGFDLGDLDIDTLKTYRQRYANLQPDHVWNRASDQEFLLFIGAWRKDRETGLAGPTKAGLLMFGKLHTIKEAFPNYMLDYQERQEARSEARWIDRVTLDGTWPGNLFSFYQRVILKLTADLKVPFELKGDQRQDDTLVHKALREALVNTLVHADYTGRASVLVVKRPDMFGFRNPGAMRVPIEAAVKGGESDCRNRLLQDMFRYVGLGENAGSGLPKIFDGWHSQHWRQPLLHQKESPSEQTLLELHTLSLIPEGAIDALREGMDSQVFSQLTDDERLILVTAQIETTIDHRRMMTILNLHPRDLSTLLSSLVEKGLLHQEGSGRGTIYFLTQARLDDAVKTALSFEESPLLSGRSSGGLGDSSGGLTVSSGGLEDLAEIAKPIASRKKTPRGEVEQAIMQMCRVQPCTLEQLVALLNRSANVIRKDYLQPMIKDRRLRFLYPTMPHHPDQAYIADGGE